MVRDDLRYLAEPSHPRISDIQPLDDLLHYVREYSRERPETFALVCLGVGFILGWKLKPW